MPTKIEITKTTVETISGKSKATQKDFSFRKQQCWLHMPKEVYPSETEIIINDDQTPYPVGMYVLCDSSIYVDRNGRLAINPVLKPIPASPAQKKVI